MVHREGERERELPGKKCTSSKRARPGKFFASPPLLTQANYFFALFFSSLVRGLFVDTRAKRIAG